MNSSHTPLLTDNLNATTQIQTTAAYNPGNALYNNSQTFHDGGNHNNSYFSFYGLGHGKISNILNGIIVFSALTVLVNCVVLIASKFTTGGKSSTLVFIRSLCIADALIGNFGIFKSVLLQNLNTRLINCFLPESIFVSASTTICLSLFWLNMDSYLRLTKPLVYRMDKHNVIIAMLVLWNSAFIIGFLPQMGWNNEEYVCNLFNYYSVKYVTFVSIIWLACISGSWFMQVILYQTRKKIEGNSHFISPQSLEYKKYTQLIVTIKTDVIILTFCYLPLIIYVYIYYTQDRYKFTLAANTNMIFFLPLFLLRSFFGAFIHSYRTIRIQRVVKDVSKSMNMSLCQRILDFNESSSDGTPSGQESRVNSVKRSNTSIAEVPQDLGHKYENPRSQHLKPHKQLCATASVITTVTEEDELSDNSELTKF